MARVTFQFTNPLQVSQRVQFGHCSGFPTYKAVLSVCWHLFLLSVFLWIMSMLSRSSWYILLRDLCPFGQTKKFAEAELSETDRNVSGLSSSIRNRAAALWQSSFLLPAALLHCEWATHELRQRKRDGQNCLSHFCPFSWNRCVASA